MVRAELSVLFARCYLLFYCMMCRAMHELFSLCYFICFISGALAPSLSSVSLGLCQNSIVSERRRGAVCIECNRRIVYDSRIIGFFFLLRFVCATQKCSEMQWKQRKNAKMKKKRVRQTHSIENMNVKQIDFVFLALFCLHLHRTRLEKITLSWALYSWSHTIGLKLCHCCSGGFFPLARSLFFLFGFHRLCSTQ